MSIDERLEAITHTLELVSQMHLDNERKYEERFARIDERFARLDERITRVVNIVEKLAQVVESHERRLDSLEG